MAEYKFELTNTSYVTGSTTTTEVTEPNGFTEFDSRLERDFKTGGVFFRFSEADLLLQFPGVGMTILQTAWNELGVNAEVTLTISKRNTPDDAFLTEYTGIAIMKNRHKIYNETLEFLKELEEDGKVFIFRPKDLLKVGRTTKDSKKLERLYNQGYTIAKERMKDLTEWIFPGHHLV